MIYGALHDIEEQCNEQGYTLGEKKDLIDTLHHDLNMCHIHGILTDSEWSKGLARLNKLVGKYAVKLATEGNE